MPQKYPRRKKNKMIRIKRYKTVVGQIRWKISKIVNLFDSTKIWLISRRTTFIGSYFIYELYYTFQKHI